jgi:hypothetical protein
MLLQDPDDLLFRIPALLHPQSLAFNLLRENSSFEWPRFPGAGQSLAQDVRVYWPRAHILIFGTPSADFEDSLYDTAINHRCRPEELLDALFRLSDGSQDSGRDSPTSLEDGSLMLPAINGHILRYVPTESDPTKQIESNSVPPGGGVGFPSGESHTANTP